MVISDNAKCFEANSLSNFMNQYGIKWMPTLAYAPMSNERAEKMVGSLKRSLKKTVLSEKTDWDLSLGDVMYGYRH